MNSPLLSKISSAYNWYRREQMKLAADSLKTVTEIPELHSGIYRLSEADMFKNASPAEEIAKSIGKVVSGTTPRTIAMILGAIPLALMYSAHLRGEERKGQPVGPIKELIAEHPWITTMGLAAGIKKIMETPQGQRAADELFSVAKKVWYGPNGP
jgi:hypothetical protein